MTYAGSSLLMKSPVRMGERETSEMKRIAPNHMRSFFSRFMAKDNKELVICEIAGIPVPDTFYLDLRHRFLYIKTLWTDRKSGKLLGISALRSQKRHVKVQPIMDLTNENRYDDFGELAERLLHRS